MYRIPIRAESRDQILKYILISATGYIFVFSGLFIFIELFKFNEKLSFCIIYGICYIFLYYIQLKVLFNSQHDHKKFLKFVFYLIFLYLLANLLYNSLNFLNFHYLLSTAISVTILIPIRFIIIKYYVYKN